MLSRRALIAALAATPTGLMGLGSLLSACQDALPAPEPAAPAPTAAQTAVNTPSFPVPLLQHGADFQAGMNLAHIHRGGRGYGSEACRAQLQALAALGVSHVALTPFGYLSSVGSTAIRFGGSLDATLTDADLAAAARQAQALGMKVVLKPHIWSPAFWHSGKSRQDMAPSDGDWDAWFAAYSAFALHYAKVAQDIGATLFVVGLEYLQATLARPGAWAEVARACRQVFKGRLSYAANWWKEADAFTDWAAFDFIGVNAYYPLSEQPDPDVQTLVDAWQPHLDRIGALSRQFARPVLFTEAGMAAVEGAAARPWDHDARGPTDEALQARAYEALLVACTPRPWFAGVYWWKWFTATGAESEDRYSPAGRLAEGVLRRWWAG